MKCHNVICSNAIHVLVVFIIQIKYTVTRQIYKFLNIFCAISGKIIAEDNDNFRILDTSLANIISAETT